MNSKISPKHGTDAHRFLFQVLLRMFCVIDTAFSYLNGNDSYISDTTQVDVTNLTVPRIRGHHRMEYTTILCKRSTQLRNIIPGTL